MASRYQTLDEYIDNDYFYHISLAQNKESILKNGLLAKKGAGIYVVRSANPEVAKVIFDHYLIGDWIGDGPNYDALIIKIDPKRHGISRELVRMDHAENCPTVKLHSLIRKTKIVINNEDITEINWRPGKIDYGSIQQELLEHPDELITYNPKEEQWQFVQLDERQNKWIPKR